MEEMIRHIVEVDRKAQEVLADAQREKLNAETVIAEKIAQLQENYLEQARRRIRIDSENERTLFEQRWKKRQRYFDRQSENLKARYDREHDAWIAAIVAAVTGSAPSGPKKGQ